MTIATFEEFEKGLANVPIIQEIIRQNPDKEDVIKQRLWEAYRKNGIIGARQESGALAEQYLNNNLAASLPRAQDENLIETMTSLISLQSQLAAEDPELCYNLFTRNPKSENGLYEHFGRVRMFEFSNLVADLMRNAHTNIPHYDRTEARRLIADTMQKHMKGYDTHLHALMQKKRSPSSQQDYRSMCEFMTAYFEKIFASDNAVIMLREALRKDRDDFVEPNTSKLPSSNDIGVRVRRGTKLYD